MKQDRLESFVRNHRDEFDNLAPSSEVWGRISKEMGGQRKVIWFKSTRFRAAAVVLVVLISSALVVSTVVKFGKESVAVTNMDPEMKELIEAEAYYAQQVSGKLTEIKKCYNLVPELKMEVEGDLIELETMYNNLKRDLRENVSNKEVIEAMIDNNRNRMKLVDDVLAQIKC